MNKNTIRNYSICSVVFIIITGIFLHFTYKVFDQNIIIAAFSAINESIWEHLKLLYFPMLITLLIGYFYIGKSIPNFLCSKTVGIIVSILFTITFFYTYSGIIGKDISIIDISLFFVSAILEEYVTYKLMNSSFKCDKKIAILTLVLVGICFITFTYFTPKLEIFRDPITRQFGLY